MNPDSILPEHLKFYILININSICNRQKVKGYTWFLFNVAACLACQLNLNYGFYKSLFF